MRLFLSKRLGWGVHVGVIGTPVLRPKYGPSPLFLVTWFLTGFLGAAWLLFHLVYVTTVPRPLLPWWIDLILR